MARDETIPRTSMVDVVTERLRRELLTGEIEPGGRIRVGDLERRFGVSHIPIREALRRLEVEGLVVTSPQRATLAAGIALDDLAALYDLRRIVEVPVAMRAADRAEEEDVERVRSTLAKLEKAAEKPESEEFWQQHRTFHSFLLEPGSSPWIKRVLDQTWQSAERYVRLTASTFGTIEHAMADHREMVMAFDDGDGMRLGELVEQHLTHTELTLRDGYLALREGGDLPADA